MSWRVESELREILRRQVHAVAPRVLADVADDVGELEGETEVLGVLQRRRIAEAEDGGRKLADDAGHQVAIAAQRLEVGVAVVHEVHLHAVDDLVHARAVQP
jgi:hypothetical protein